MIRKKLVLLCLTVFFTLTMSSTVSAYIYGGAKWPYNNTLYVFRSTVPDTWKASIRSAAATWSNSGANFSFYNSESAINTVGAVDYGYYNGYAAITRINYSGTTITSVWTDFNTYFDFSPTGAIGYTDVQSVAVHEFGHWLKLNDISDSSAPSSVMWKQLSTSKIRRSLYPDDIAGIKFIYGSK